MTPQLPRPTLATDPTVPAAEELARGLRESGRRLTPQRQMVLEAVNELEHATPEEVFARVHASSSAVNISTVYRSLELLEQLGLVSHTHLGPGATTYHQAREVHHLHLVCRGCGHVAEVPSSAAEELLARVREAEGFVVDVAHLSLYGRCAGCGAQA